MGDGVILRLLKVEAICVVNIIFAIIVTSNLCVVELRTNSYRNDRANQDKKYGRSDQFWEEQTSRRVFYHFDQFLQNQTVSAVRIGNNNYHRIVILGLKPSL